MATNLPTFFLDEIRSEIIDSTTYTDRELETFIRTQIKRVDPLLGVTTDMTDGASVWDFTITPITNKEYWEVIKYASVVSILNNYKQRLIAQGIGVSIGLGSERIDTKTLLNTVKDLTKDANKTLKEKILVYNMNNRNGSCVDLYYKSWIW